VPEGWELSLLTEFCGFITKGSTPTTYGFKWAASGILFLRSQCVAEDGLDLEQSMYISPAAHEALRRSVVHDGDILITITGNVGRVVHLTGIGSANINQHIARIRITWPCVEPRYIYQFLSQPGVRKHFESITTGQAYPQISLRQVRNQVIALPSYSEQHAIAEALSDVDGLLGALKELIAKKQAIKWAAMQQLLTGKTRLPGFSGEWEVKRLGEVASIRNKKVLPSQVDADTLCVELEHIGQGDGRLLEASLARFSTSSKYRFFAGDVLFGRLRSYLRKHWRADRDGICTTEIWPLAVDPHLADSSFLHAIVQSDGFVDAASISYGTHMPRADWDVLRNFEVALPQVPEQRAIATALSDMDAEIEAVERRRDKTRAIKQGMMQQLLTGRIRLVKPQPTTEPQ